jgi:putative ABC transport system permease protein
LAAPLGWWIMSRWLENYEYAFDMTWWVFAMEILIISFICLLTIGFRSAKAALTNPVNSLRTE